MYPSDNSASTTNDIMPTAPPLESTANLSLRNLAASSHPSSVARYPTYHASGICKHCDTIAYEACVRLCQSFSEKGCVEAAAFLANECLLLRDAFRLKNVLLQSRDEGVRNEFPVYADKKEIRCKIKVQVHKVQMGMKQPSFRACSPLKSFTKRFSAVKSIIAAERKALRTDRLAPVATGNASLLQKSLAHVTFGTQRFAKHAIKLIKISSNAWRSTSSQHDMEQELYTCQLRLKSSPEVDAVRKQPGTGENFTFVSDGLGDELIIEVHDSEGNYCGRASVKMADIADQMGSKLVQCPIHVEPGRHKVGKIQLYVTYSTMSDANNHRCASISETAAFDCLLETAMKAQHFSERNLLLHGSWRWLVTEFSSHYRVSDSYPNLRYLSYIMDVATPTADCLTVVHDLLLPVLVKGDNKQTLSHHEVCIKDEVTSKIEQILCLTFENYKSLDESSRTGLVDTFRPATGLAALALAPALKIYDLLHLHDKMSPEIQSKLCRYFQNAMKMRVKRHFEETDELISTSRKVLMDSVALARAYQKMKSLCFDIINEIFIDVEIHEKYTLLSFIDLPKLSMSIYSTELCTRLQGFLVSCPALELTPFVVELILATADFQRNLSLSNISNIEGGVDAKELFKPYIARWIEDKRLALLALCNLEKQLKTSSCPLVYTTTFIDDIYSQLNATLTAYDAIASLWPEEYITVLENAVADVEMAVMKCLEKQYAKVLAPLRKSKMPIKPGIKCVQKLANRNVCPYAVSNELGVLLNSMKRILTVLQPQTEAQVKLWGSVPGESLREVAAVIESEFRVYVQAVVDKLVENTKLHRVTKLKKIIKSTKGNEIESNLRRWMEELVTRTIDDLIRVLDPQVFVIVCRDFWDRIGEDVLKFVTRRTESRSRCTPTRISVTNSPMFQLSPLFQLADKKADKSWYHASRLAVTVLNETFTFRMQELLGNNLKDNDLNPPKTIANLLSMLSIDV